MMKKIKQVTNERKIEGRKKILPSTNTNLICGGTGEKKPITKITMASYYS